MGMQWGEETETCRGKGGALFFTMKDFLVGKTERVWYTENTKSIGGNGDGVYTFTCPYRVQSAGRVQ